MAKKVTKPEPQAPETPPASKAVALKETKTAVVKSTGGRKLTGRGFENLEMTDILLPRIKLTQNGSPEVVDKSAKAGEIILALSGENFGGKGVLITPIMHFRSRIKWKDRDDGGGIECSSPDGKIPRDTTKFSPTCSTCTHAEWDNTAKKKKDMAPKCTLYDNFLVMVNDSTEPIIIPFERTKMKVSKKLYSMGALSGGDMWARQYKLSVVEEKNEEGQPYYNYAVANSEKKVTEERQKKCEQLWESMVGKVISEQNQDSELNKETAGAAATEGKY